MNNKKVVTFDASAINQIADDPTDALCRALPIAYKVRITGTSLVEVSATTKRERRERLINVLRLLLSDGICIMPYQFIMSICAKEYLKSPKEFRWDKLKLRFKPAEDAIARHEFLDKETSDRTRNENKRWAKDFEEMHRRERVDFEEYFADSGDERPSFQRHCQIALGESGPGWGLASTLFEKSTGIAIDEAQAKHFMKKCPPMRGILISLLWALYRKSVLDTRGLSIGDAGRHDLMSAAYLPYCDIFVTDDSGQYNSLRNVAEEADLPTNIMLYKDFAASILGL